MKNGQLNVYDKAHQQITACVKWSDRSGAAKRSSIQAAWTSLHTTSSTHNIVWSHMEKHIL